MPAGKEVNSMNLLTMIVLGYLVLAMITGFVRGFIKTFFSMILFVLVIATTALISPAVTAVVEDSQYVQSFVDERSKELIASGTQNFLDENGGDSAAALSLAIIGSALQINGVKNFAADEISGVAMKGMGSALAFVLSLVFWLIIEIILNRIGKKKLISPINRFLGLILGLFSALIQIWIAFGIISVFQFTAFGAALMEQITASPLLALIEAGNPVIQVISYILLQLIG